MDVAKFLKFAFIMSVVLYAVVAVAVAGAPGWSRPLVPENPGSAPILGILLFMSLAAWASGMVVGRMAEAPGALRRTESQSPWPRLRFTVAAALLESGALFGLVLSLLNRDSRFAIFTAAITIILLALTPASDDSKG